MSGRWRTVESDWRRRPDLNATAMPGCVGTTDTLAHRTKQRGVCKGRGGRGGGKKVWMNA